MHVHVCTHWYTYMLTYWFSFNYVRNWEQLHHLLAVAVGGRRNMLKVLLMTVYCNHLTVKKMLVNCKWNFNCFSSL